jgi:Inorganic pyrophosphatase
MAHSPLFDMPLAGADAELVQRHELSRRAVSGTSMEPSFRCGIDRTAMVDRRKLPLRDKKGDVYVVVETPRGSAAKLEFDPDLQLFTLSKSLILGLSYPYDWGFIPSTEGEDGDPIDALILHDVATTGPCPQVQDHRRAGSRANRGWQTRDPQ